MSARHAVEKAPARAKAGPTRDGALAEADGGSSRLPPEIGLGPKKRIWPRRAAESRSGRELEEAWPKAWAENLEKRKPEIVEQRSVRPAAL
jgi:hypothetical protein